MKCPPSGIDNIPSKFKKWRDNQLVAINDYLDTCGTHNIIAHRLPTGSGKSLTYMALCNLLKLRTVILTVTKDLQRQLLEDFPGVAVVMGKTEYVCRMHEGTCEEGPCNIGVSCSYRDCGCTYYDAIKYARNARVVLTNYAFWLTEKGRLGPFDLMVLDEGHRIHTTLLDVLAIRISDRFLDSIGAKRSAPTPTWEYIDYLDNYMRSLDMSSLTDRQRVRALRLKQEIATLDIDNYVLEKSQGVLCLDPIWPESFKDTLFKSSSSYYIVSASLSPKILEVLGLKNAYYKEFESDFPASRRPLYVYPAVKLDYRTSDVDLKYWVMCMDQFISQAQALGRGIIHTVSYQRQEYIFKHSRHKNIMITHDPGKGLRKGLTKFKNMKNGVLLSPVVTTGLDFSYDMCKYQILSKIPFISTQRAVDKRRQEVDPEWTMLLTATCIEQSLGRGMRAKDDSCISLLLDKNWLWFYKKYKHLFSEDFKKSVIIVNSIPKIKKEVFSGCE